MKNKKKQEVSDSDVSIENDISNSKANSTTEKRKSPKKKHVHRYSDDDELSESDNDVSRNDNNLMDSPANKEIGSPQKNGEKSTTKNSCSIESSTIIKSTYDVADLSSDDEIYTFQCPDNYDKKELCNKILDFGTLNKLVNSKSNEVLQIEVIKSEKKFITLAVPNRKRNGLINLPLRGHIVVEKVTDMIENVDESDVEESSEVVSFPNDLVVRHPLLGPDWQTHIEQANFAIKCNKKKMEKEKKERKQQEANEIEEREPIINSPAKKKKKKCVT